ncbi:hypothetical protein L21SP5_03306 [Salinivirga cyanobacteriivorans]|uniref:Uncharacterized protein n=1 Tax=Salinivirga cyanobacteriivorans TaxID=1307839 RepID=A0A0S2I3W4_9BACT|nr:hypothetical protein [Salinivirga cyanobacteriivorans]ALO16919.1 hypothetical protein L21SP5_03306 [Salinivirga cyanobacteriivorans]
MRQIKNINLLLSFTLLLMSCSSTEQEKIERNNIKKEAKKTGETTKAFIATEKAAIIKGLEKEAEQIQNKITRLKLRTKARKSDTKAKEMLNKIEQEYKKLSYNLKNLKRKSDTVFTSKRKTVEQQIEALNKNILKTQNSLKE